MGLKADRDLYGAFLSTGDSFEWHCLSFIAREP